MDRFGKIHPERRGGRARTRRGGRGRRDAAGNSDPECAPVSQSGRWCGCRTRSPSRRPARRRGGPNADVARIRPAMDLVATDLCARAGKAKGETKEVLEATAMMASTPSWPTSRQRRARAASCGATRRVGRRQHVPRPARRRRRVRRGASERRRGRPQPHRRRAARRPGAGHPRPRPPVRPGRPRPRPGRHRHRRPGEGARLRDRGGRPDQPHRDPGPGARHPGRRRRRRRAARCRGHPGGARRGTGTLDTAPDDATVQDAEERAARRGAKRAGGPGATADGRRITLLANIGDPAGAQAAAAAGAEGVGLFRTEFLFLDRGDEPSAASRPRPTRRCSARSPRATKVVVRTLDAGADKPLPFLDQGEEANPALGVRGSADRPVEPEVLDNQLRAIAAAARARGADVWVMAPMVAVLSEARGSTGTPARPACAPPE